MLFMLKCDLIAIDLDVPDIKTWRYISRKAVVPKQRDASMNDVPVARQFAMR